MKRALIATACMAGLIGASCLPGDIRPEPGHIFVLTQGSPAAVNGFTTDDGWSVHFDKLLAGLGYGIFGRDTCNVYGESRYDRLFSFTVPDAQKLADMHAIGDCDVQFRLSAPLSTAYLGNGVTEEDRTFMRRRQTIWFKRRTRTAVYVKGTATRGDITKKFDWRFTALYTLTDCTRDEDGNISTSFHLKGKENLQPVVMFHAEDLFRESLDPDAAINFEPFAKADKNKSGTISLTEVATMTAPMVDEPEMDAGLDDAGVEESKLQGRAKFMREHLLPRIFRFDGSPCRNVPEKSAINVPIDFEIDI